jgi:hypothetical protein
MASSRNNWVKIVIWVIVATMVLTFVAALVPAVS